MRTTLVVVGLVLASARFSAAQTASAPPEAGTPPEGFSLSFAGGPRGYLSGGERRTGVIQLGIRLGLPRSFAFEGELVGGGGSDGDVHLPEIPGGRPVVTHFAGNLGLNLLYRTPGRVGFIASAGPGLYFEQRDTELRKGDDSDEPNVIERNNSYTFGMQASAGVDIALRSAGLFSIVRYEARALRAPDKLANWQVLTGVRFPLWF